MQITYKDKVTLQSNPNIPDENKVTAKDMNELKSVVNSNEEEQQALNMSVQEIAQNVVNNSQEISNIKEEQTTQNDNIQTNSNNISDLQSNKADKSEIPTDLSQLSNENTKFVNETGLENAISQEKTQRQNADNNLQNQIDAITASTDVIDIVGTYQDLQDYDTSKVKQNDVIKVLQDSTHNNAMSYYRWQNQWIYVGSEGPYYTIGQTDELLQGKANQSDLNQTNTNVTNLAERVSNNEIKIENIEQEQTTQNTNISTNATNIESLQEENENLKKIVAQMPQVTGQGTEVTLENTIEAQFTKFDVEGNSTQETTEGYNMLDLEKYSYSESSSALNGGTVTIKDGIITVDARNATGTANAMSETRISTADSIEAGTYYFGVDVYGAYESTPSTNIWQYKGNRTLTEKFLIKQWKFGVTQGNIASTPIIISNDTSKTTYEKYTNGASPNSNYEQPIKSAGDNENYLKEEWEQGAYSGSNGVGKIDSNQYVRSKEFSTIEPNKEYTSKCVVNGVEHTQGNIFFYKEDESFISSITNISSTFTTPENAKKVKYNIFKSSGITPEDVDYAKLEKGNKASGYSPYGMGSINDKIQTRNLLENTVVSQSLNGLTISKNKDKSIKINGTTTSSTTLVLNNLANIHLSAGTYTFSLIGRISNVNNLEVYDINLNRIALIGISSSAQSVTVTFNKDVVVGKVLTYFNNNVTYNNVLYPMIEPGSTATQYVPHEEQDYSIFVQQPMRSIGDVRDGFAKVDGVWNEVHYIDRKIFNGTEGWSKQNTSSTSNSLFICWGYVTNPGKATACPNSYGVLSNYFKKVTENIWTGAYKGIDVYGNQAFICVSNEIASTVADFKTWLSTHNVEVNYVLKNPTYLPCTEEQIAQLENKPSTYKEMTIINSEDETEGYLEVSGIYDLNKLITRTEVLESES